MLVFLEKLIKNLKTKEFQCQMGFSKMHALGTPTTWNPAATALNQVDPKVMAERAKKMRGLGNAMRLMLPRSLLVPLR